LGGDGYFINVSRGIIDMIVNGGDATCVDVGIDVEIDVGVIGVVMGISVDGL
ncbi:hypothetical protein KI387_002620, partial [Taxus chinensis]